MLKLDNAVQRDAAYAYTFPKSDAGRDAKLQIGYEPFDIAVAALSEQAPRCHCCQNTGVAAYAIHL